MSIESEVILLLRDIMQCFAVGEKGYPAQKVGAEGRDLLSVKGIKHLTGGMAEFIIFTAGYHSVGWRNGFDKFLARCI